VTLLALCSTEVAGGFTNQQLGEQVFNYALNFPDKTNDVRFIGCDQPEGSKAKLMPLFLEVSCFWLAESSLLRSQSYLEANATLMPKVINTTPMSFSK